MSKKAQLSHDLNWASQTPRHGYRKKKKIKYNTKDFKGYCRIHQRPVI